MFQTMYPTSESNSCANMISFKKLSFFLPKALRDGVGCEQGFDFRSQDRIPRPWGTLRAWLVV